MSKNSIKVKKDRYFDFFICFLIDSTPLNNDVIRSHYKKMRDNFFISVVCTDNFVNFHASHLNIWNSLVDKYCSAINVLQPEKDTEIILDLLIKGIIMICNNKYNVRNASILPMLTRAVPPIKESSGKLRGRTRWIYLTDAEKNFLSRLGTYNNK